MAAERALSIAVLAGGEIGEREISLITGRAIHDALVEAGHRPLLVVLEPSDGPPLWSHDGRAAGPLELIEGPLAAVDLFFLALHGGAGEGGLIQGFLETLGLTYTGSSVAASALCLDKLCLLERADLAGLRTSPRAVFAPGDLDAEPARALPGAERGLVIKPRHGGSSVATSLVTSGEARDLARAIALVHDTGDDALVEVRCPGVEASVGILEDADGSPRALPVVEILPQSGSFFDYEQKYDPGGAIENCPPEGLPEAVQARLTQLALAVYRLAGCRTYARVDFMCPHGELHDGFDEPVLLETNTLPGLTPRSLFPLEAKAAGLSFPELCETIALAALGAAQPCKATHLAAE